MHNRTANNTQTHPEISDDEARETDSEVPAYNPDEIRDSGDYEGSLDPSNKTQNNLIIEE